MTSRPSYLTAAAVAVLLATTAFALHALAIVPVIWSELPLTRFEPGTGLLFTTPLDTTWMSRRIVGEPPAVILENGVPLACPVSEIPFVAEHGHGRFVIADRQAYLSTSDGSDPRTNGRRYVLRWPAPPPSWRSRPVLVLTAVLIALSALRILFVLRAPLIRLVIIRPLTVAMILLVVPFVVHRAWFFLDVPLPGIEFDTTTYYEPARTLMQGQWPHFDVRPPGFPLWLAGTLSASHSLLAVTVLQTLLALASGLIVVYGAYRLRPGVAPWVAVAMAGYMLGFWPLQFDTSILSESLYTSAMVMSAGFFLLAMATGHLAAWAAVSTAMAVVIATRPAGLFLVVPYAMTVAYLLMRRRSRAQAAAFAAPFAILLLSLSSYNYSRSGVFNVTAWGEANLALATVTMWDKSDSYPAAVNNQIDVIQAATGLTEAERAVLAHSWSPTALAPLFLKGITQEVLAANVAIGGSYADSRAWMRRLSLRAIARHPIQYTKFVSSMSYLYFIENISWRADHGDFLKGRALALLTNSGREEMRQRRPLIHEMVSSYFVPAGGIGIRMNDECTPVDSVGALVPTPARRLHRLAQIARDMVFARLIWVVLYLVVLVAAAIRVFRSRGSHQHAFMLLTLGLWPIGAGMIVVLTEYAGHRYSYPSEFVMFLLVALAPLLWVREPGDRVPDSTA